MKIFISQPLTGIPEEESTAQRIEAENALKYYYKNEEIEFLHHTEETAPDDIDTKRVWYLGMSITILARADIVAFLPGWDESEGCKIEHKVAEEYDYERIESSEMWSILEKYRERDPMTVSDIIKELSKCNPKSTVVFSLNDNFYPIYGQNLKPTYKRTADGKVFQSEAVVFETKEDEE